jgi:hypothetical protein
MVRILSERDISLLSSMAPEFSGESCRKSGVEYKSVLPPVANHYSKDAPDFGERIGRLSDNDILYLIDLILSGEESLHCLKPDFFSFLDERIRSVAGTDIARKVRTRYLLESE